MRWVEHDLLTGSGHTPPLLAGRIDTAQGCVIVRPTVRRRLAARPPYRLLPPLDLRARGSDTRRFCMVALLYRRLADLVRRFVLPSLRGTIPPMFSADVGAARAALCVPGVGETIPVGEPDPPRASLLRKNGMLRKSLYVRSNLLSAGPPKMTVGACWAAWEEGGSASSGSEFLQRVASWIEGTAAQLLRDHWRTGAKRPSSTELQERLRHHLALIAHDGQATTYLEALELARHAVLEEICRARAETA